LRELERVSTLHCEQAEGLAHQMGQIFEAITLEERNQAISGSKLNLVSRSAIYIVSWWREAISMWLALI
jgi:hypothetical protein